MSKRPTVDKAHKILILAGIKANSRAYKTLKPTVDEMVNELHEMNTKEQAAFAVSAIQIYERYIRNAYDMQHKTIKEKQEEHIINLDNFPGAIDALLKKISLHMHENKTTKISHTELNQIFGTKAQYAKELLDRCPLIKNDPVKNHYKFIDSLKTQLKNYFAGLMHSKKRTLHKAK